MAVRTRYTRRAATRETQGRAARPSRRARGARPSAGRRPGEREPGTGHPRRGGDREVGAAEVRGRQRVRLSSGPSGRHRVRDGAPLRGPAPAVRADARPRRATARAAAGCARDGVRARREGPRGPFRGRTRRAQPALRGRSRAAAPVCDRRRPVAGQRVSADHCVRRPTPAGRVDRAAVRGPGAQRDTGAARTARAAAWEDSGIATLASCSTRRGPGDSTSRSGIASSPSHAGTRWRSSSCRETCRRPSSRAASSSRTWLR